MTKPLHAGHAACSGVMAALLAKAGFSAEPDILAQGYSFARMFAPDRVTVELSDGRRIQGRTGEARGHPGNPLTDDELEAKFRECTEGILSDEDIGGALVILARLEDLGQVSKFLNLFRKRA